VPGDGPPTVKAWVECALRCLMRLGNATSAANGARIPSATPPMMPSVEDKRRSPGLRAGGVAGRDRWLPNPNAGRPPADRADVLPPRCWARCDRSLRRLIVNTQQNL